MVKDMTSAELKQALVSHMEATGKSQVQVAREIGKSGSVISSYLQDKYGQGGRPGDLDALEKLIRNLLEKARAREFSVPRAIAFTPTYNSMAFFSVADKCLVNCDLRVLTGDAGVGKTMSAIEYARQHPEVILVLANMCFTARVLFQHLCNALDLPPNGSVHEMFRSVVDKLNGSERLIIVDQAEYLPYGALEMLRSVYDEAKVGVLLVGMHGLYHNLRKSKGNNHAQLYSRVAGHYKLEFPLRDEEVKAMVDARLQGSSVDWKLFRDASRGNARNLHNLVKGAKEKADENRCPIDAEIVKLATRNLMG